MAGTESPFINVGPGDLLKEDLETLNWTQEDLANILGMTKKGVNEILNNKTPITIETAQVLGKAFGQSPQFWLSLSANYRLREKATGKKESDAELKANIYRHMPVRDMITKGWLRDYDRVEELVLQVRRFWGISSIDFSFMENRTLPAFRKSDQFQQYRSFYAHTWFQMAKNKAGKRNSAPFSKEKLKKITSHFAGYTIDREGAQTFLRDLSKCGVKFIVLSHLEKTYIDGASFYDGKNPVIVYTARHNRLDNFWFTMAHEIAHVLLHLKKGAVFIDTIDGSENPAQDCRETEADELASQMIRTKEILDYCSHMGRYISHERVERCSTDLNVGASLVVGVLQYHGILSPRNLNRFKEKISDRIPEKYRVDFRKPWQVR